MENTDCTLQDRMQMLVASSPATRDSNISMAGWWLTSTPLKNMSQLGLSFSIYGKTTMFQTTNQIESVIMAKGVDGILMVVPSFDASPT